MHAIHTFKFLLLTTVFSTCIIFPLESYAQTTKIGEEAISLAQRIESNQATEYLVLHSENATPSQKIEILRRSIFQIITQDIDADLERFIQKYEQIAATEGTQADKELAIFFQDIFSVLDQKDLFENADKVLNKIEPYANHDDWFIASHANVYVSLFHSYKREYILALQSANRAIEYIPNLSSPAVTEANILAFEQVVYLHNLQNNIVLAVKSSEKLFDLQMDADVSISSVSKINNLMYSFGNWRDHETGKALAEILLRIESKTENTTPGLTDLRVSQVYNELGEYNSALNHAQTVLKDANITYFIEQASLQSAIAYAGLGLTDAAIKILEETGPRLSTDYMLSNTTPDGVLYAEALIALNQGKDALAIRLMNRRIDVSVQSILGRNNTDTTALLANLENNRERQEERETAIKREAQLKAAQLDAQKRINKLLALLAGFLGLAAGAAIIFARYRNKISKKLAVQTKAAQSADQMKSEFLGMVSHELRTPLNGIIGIADLLANHHKDEDVRKKTKIILDSGNDLTRMVESIIDMSHIEGDKLPIYPEVTNPFEAIKDEIEIWKTQATEKGLIFTAFIDETVNQNINFDIIRFRQCLHNLLSNAVKFTQKGRIHLHMTTALNANNTMHIQTVIADTGQGITDLVQSKLFTPFLQADSTMTRKYGGAGLNLAITRAIARMMGGDVTLMSNAGRGSEFTFTVQAPLAQISDTLAEAPIMAEIAALDLNQELHIVSDAAASTVKTPETSDINSENSDIDLLASLGNVFDLMKPDSVTNGKNLQDSSPLDGAALKVPDTADSLEGLRVLIVEDMATNRDIIRLFLDPAGCICFEAENGEAALETLKTHDVDVILMDIRMPVMDGIETTEIIRKTNNRHKDTPIIALTADSAAIVNAECLAVGMDIFLAKPVISADLTESILFLLQQRQKNHLRTLAAKS